MEDKILKILDKVGERSLFPSEAYDAILDLFKKELMTYTCNFNYDFEKGKAKHKIYVALDDFLLKYKLKDKKV